MGQMKNRSLTLRGERGPTVLPAILPVHVQTLAISTFLALATIVIRLPNFGDPTYHIDEAFYLFVGERMHEGVWPYFAVWDRKPAGLFLLYYFIAAFGEVVAYQGAASLFGWGAALTLAVITRRFAGDTAACATGVVYLVLLGALAGGGGQSPVFYNLFMALAALIVLRRALRELHHPARADTSAMLMCGLALTFKPTVLPESIFFGLALLAVHWRDHRDWRALTLHAALLAIVAVTPTAAIWLVLLETNQLETYWFATVQSIFFTEPPHPDANAVRLTYLLYVIGPSLIAALVGTALLWRGFRAEKGKRIAAAFLTGWLLSALGGVLVVPNFYDHYALPLSMPLAVAGAAVFDRVRTGAIAATLIVTQLFLVSGYPNGQLARKAQAQRGYAAAHDMMRPYAETGCVFVYDATPALYRSFRPCLASRFLFPEHLSNAREAKAIGSDPSEELERILRQSPAVIALAKLPSVSTPNWTTRNALKERLHRRYTKVGEAPLVDVVGRQRIEVWRRVAR